VAASLTLAEQVGQLMMVGISSAGLPASQAKILSRGHVGSVVLLGNTKAGRRPIVALSKRVHGVGGRPRGVSIMLAADQEGGQVQRLRGPGFERIPSARSQAGLSDRELARRAERWGRQLRAAGVDADLAPVADVVPKKLERVNRPIGLLQRGYGPDPDVVAAKVTAFVRGMHEAGVTTAVKHYPGLGRVRGNTDFETHVVDSSTTRHAHALAGFRAAASSGVDMVMMSSAYYAKIDPGHRAVFSTLVINQMLRQDAKFTGVVISDDLAARAVSDYGPGKRAVTFLRSGGDLVIVGDPRLAPAMIAAVKAEAGSNQRFRAELERKTVRVLQMKARRGLTRCQ
jgi:beta-N-acetylhexosaminidase